MVATPKTPSVNLRQASSRGPGILPRLIAGKVLVVNSAGDLDFDDPSALVGAAPIGGAAPPAVSANLEGTSDHAARRDHTHAHGNLSGGALHTAASDAAAGFVPQVPKPHAQPIGTLAGTALDYFRHVLPVLGLAYNDPGAATTNTAKIQATIAFAKALGGGALITLGDFACTVYVDPGIDFTECKGLYLGSSGGFSNTNGVRLLTASTGSTDLLIFDSCDNCGTFGLVVTATSTSYSGKLVRAQRGGIGNSDPSNLRFVDSSFFGPTGGATAYGIYLGNANQAHISGCTFEYCGTGVWIAGNQNIVDNNCNFIANRTADIDVQGENNCIYNNTFEPAGATAAEISGGQNGTHARGIINSGTAYGTEICGNWFGDSPHYQSWIRLVGALGGTILGNTFQSASDNASEDVWFNGCEAFTVAGNRSGNAVNLVKFTTGAGTNRGFVLGPNSGTEGYTGTIGSSVIGLQYYRLGSCELDAPLVKRGGLVTEAGGGFFGGWGLILNQIGVYVGAQTTLPTWGTPAGCGVFPIDASQGAYGLDGIVIAPQQNVAGAEVIFWGRDAGVGTYGQGPMGRVGPLGLILRGATTRITGAAAAYDFGTAQLTGVAAGTAAAHAAQVGQLNPAPVALADASATIQIGAGAWRTIDATTANRAITLGTAGAVSGVSRLRVTRYDSAAFTWTFTDGGSSGDVTVFSSGAPSWAEWAYVSGAWQLSSWG